MDARDPIALLQQLVRFDTTNFGAGRSAGETACAEWIAGLLRGAGYEPVLLHRADAPERANCILRVPGTDADLPGLVMHGHLDVVPCDPDEWSVDPFAGVVRDGYVWGRGVADMLDAVAMMLATLLAWADEGVRPRRDVVFAFVADEEDEGAWGAEWLVAEHPELFEGCEAAVSEDGAWCTPVVTASGETVRLYPIACAERGTLHIALTAGGVGGHGSRPSGDDAVHRLVEAVHRIGNHRWPLRLSNVVSAQIEATASALGLQVDLGDEASIQAVIDALGDAAGALRYTIRASSTPTMLEAGSKVNVVPSVARAAVDVRCPPGAVAEVEATLAELVGPDVEWAYTSHQLPVESDPDAPWMEAMRAAVAASDPEGVVVPYCMGGGTDAKAFAKLGMATYGFTPLGPDPQGRRPAGVHAADERNPVAAIEWGAVVLRRFLES